MDTPTSPAGYARISLDRAGQGLGVERQQSAIQGKCAALGWPEPVMYVDNDVSASSNKPRPSYEAMLSDLQAGTRDAVVVYDLDRLTRRPIELERFIDLADTLKASLANVSGDVDLTNANGRMIARIKGAVARQEAERIGERVTAQKQQLASKGIPTRGKYGRMYGYNEDWSLNEAETDILKDAYKRRAGDESLESIAHSMPGTTVAGLPWRSGTLSTTLANPLYKGKVAYKKVIVSDSIYPAIVSEALWNQANKKISAAKRGTSAHKYLLSPFAICHACGGNMKGNTYQVNRGNKTYTRATYRCSKSNPDNCGTTSIRIEWLDKPVLAAARNRHALINWQAKVIPDYEDDLAEVDARLKENQSMWASGDIDRAEFMSIRSMLREKRTELSSAQSKATQDTTRQDLQAMLSEWITASLSQRQSFVRSLVDHIVVGPGPGRGGRPTQDNTRITMHWHTAIDHDGNNLPTVETLTNDIDTRYLVGDKVVEASFKWSAPDD